MSVEGSQEAEFEIEKKEYSVKQKRAVLDVTDRLPELVHLCWEFLQSYPELQFRRVDRSMQWFQTDKIILAMCCKYNLQLQCMACKQFSAAESFPRRMNSDMEEGAEKNLKDYAYLTACQPCLDKCKDQQKNAVFYCNRCNFVSIVARSQGNQSIPAPARDGCFDNQGHNFILSLLRFL